MPIRSIRFGGGKNFDEIASSAPTPLFNVRPTSAVRHNDAPPLRAWAVHVEESTVRDSEVLRLKTTHTLGKTGR